MKRGLESTPAGTWLRGRALPALLSVVVLCCGVLAFGATAALAATNTYITQFSGSSSTPETAAKSFEPIGIAVNSEGDVYVGDTENDVVDEFNSTGTTLLAEFNGGGTKRGYFEPRAIAVNSSGDVYVGDKARVDEFSPSATGEPTPLAEFNGGGTKGGSFELRGLAVNSKSEDVYVADAENEVVDEFSPSATGEPTPLAEFNGKETEAKSFIPYGLAVNSSGDVYVADREHNVVDELNSSTTEEVLGEITGSETLNKSFNSVAAVALAPSGDVYVSTSFGNNVVDRFKPKGTSGNEQYEYEYECQVNGTGSAEQCGRKASKTPQESFEPRSLAVAPSGELYVGDTEHGVVDIFSSDVKVVLPKFKLIVAESTEGEVVGSEGATGIKCGTGAACEVEVEEGEPVTLTSEHFKTGFTFEKWTTSPNASLCTTTNPCTFTMPKENVNVAAKYEPFTKHPLTVRVTGKGEVNDGKVIVNCTSSGGTCTEEAEGKVTLTAAPTGSGSVFAGWIGECQKETPTECEVNVTAATKVTAVFLLEGVQGKNGESPTITAIVPGVQCPAGGFEIVFQGHIEYLCNGIEGEIGREGGIGEEGLPGKMGAPGERGTVGASGATGSAGAQGPPGPAGPAGKEGPAGKVTCKVQQKGKKVKVTCTVNAAKASAARVHWSLSRHGHAVAHGAASGGNVRLNASGLPAGRYTLTLISVSGKNETIRSEAFTLR
jgi:uncharacterized repeat protein (TIGR02543 family)